MNLLQDMQKMAVKMKRPVIQPGYTVRVHQKIKEGEKERVQIFEGLVIKLNSGYGADKTFTVRKIIGGIGVEKIFSLYSPNIIKIEVKKKSKVRRAKLYYMRERSGKSARLKQTRSDSPKAESEVSHPPQKEGQPEKATTTEPPKPQEAPEKEEKAPEESAKTEPKPPQEPPKSEEKSEKAPPKPPESTLEPPKSEK
jgi:large subunit ribosomal protein L19